MEPAHIKTVVSVETQVECIPCFCCRLCIYAACIPISVHAESILIIEMEGAPHGLDASIKFSTGHYGKWPDHVGKKQVLDLANLEWNRINHSHGWVARI